MHRKMYGAVEKKGKKIKKNKIAWLGQAVSGFDSPAML